MPRNYDPPVWPRAGLLGPHAVEERALVAHTSACRGWCVRRTLESAAGGTHLGIRRRCVQRTTALAANAGCRFITGVAPTPVADHRTIYGLAEHPGSRYRHAPAGEAVGSFAGRDGAGPERRIAGSSRSQRRRHALPLRVRSPGRPEARHGSSADAPASGLASGSVHASWAAAGGCVPLPPGGQQPLRHRLRPLQIPPHCPEPGAGVRVEYTVNALGRRARAASSPAPATLGHASRVRLPATGGQGARHPSVQHPVH